APGRSAPARGAEVVPQPASEGQSNGGLGGSLSRMAGELDRVEVAIVGAGQAGPPASQQEARAGGARDVLGGVARAGVEPVVLERGRVAETWRRRWDSFCLVTPNWTVQLPGGAYDGDEPDGFMLRNEIVAFLEHYAAAAPVRTGVKVTLLAPSHNRFVLETSDGTVAARSVVVATGAYQRPHRPAAAA